MSNWETLKNTIIKGNYCCGCGVCVGVCPQLSLKMIMDELGEYKPSKIGYCNNCGICYRVCPFSDNGFNEDKLSGIFLSDTNNLYNKDIGYYSECLVGYAEDRIRLQSASGGLLTWTIIHLLEKQKIDFAICVKPLNRIDKLFNFTVCSSIEDVMQCSRSCYYPVELSDVIKKILDTGGKYAVVGLPCVLKALRNAELVNKKLKSRIKYHLGLVCGQQKSAQYADYLCYLGGGKPQNLESFSFRIKDLKRDASDIGVRLSYKVDEKLTIKRDIFWTEGMREAWCNGYFKLNACNYCDDLFAELSDVSYMDAWLPEYIKDPAGTSIVVIRNRELQNEFYTAAKSNVLNLITIEPEKVIASQIGALQIKKNRLAEILTYSQKNTFKIPIKRVNPLPKNTKITNVEIKLLFKIIQSSKVGLRIQKKIGNKLIFFKIWMFIHSLPLRITRKYLKIINKIFGGVN